MGPRGNEWRGWQGVMALFLGTTVNKIDRKGRVSVPAAFRDALAGQSFKGIVAFRSLKHPAVQCGGMDWMESISAGVNEFDLFSQEHDDLTAALFADSQPLAFDGDGRIVLPAPLVEHAMLTDHAAFVGRGHQFEIWAPAAFKAYQESARTRISERGLTVRQTTGGSATSG